MTTPEADLDHLAHLARLDLDAHERDALRGDLERLLGYVALLQEVDVEGVAPMLRPTPQEGALRDDEVVNPPGSTLVRDLAPEWDDGRVRVPRTVDQDA